MAKVNERELMALKRKVAKFNLVGEAKVGEYTFAMDNESQKSDWIYNRANIQVDCGEQGFISAEMMGGYGKDRDNIQRVMGKKAEGEKTASRLEVAWEDRKSEKVLKEVNPFSLITVGLEVGEDEKTIYKKFISPYDAIAYMNEHLEDGMKVNIKGNLKWQTYNEETKVKREITSIVLSKVEKEDYKATFSQTIYCDDYSIGKLDKETMTFPITASIVDYVKEYDGTLVKTNLPMTKTLDFVVEDQEKAKKILKLFKPDKKGKNKVVEITVDGIFTKGGVSTVEVSESDIPSDIKELIEIGYVEKEDILKQMALQNGGSKVEKMIIKKPTIEFAGEDKKLPRLLVFQDIYMEDDLNINLILESLNIEKVEEVEDESNVSDEQIDDLINKVTDEDDDDIEKLFD